MHSPFPLHVFEEVVRSECRHERSAASMPDIIRSAKPPAVTLANTRLKAIYRQTLDHALMTNISHVYRDGASDVAVCHLTFQSDAPEDCVFERKMAIHAGPVPPGLNVAAVAYSGMEQTRSYIDERAGVAWSVHQQHLAFEHGQCIEYFPQRAPRGPVGPSFEINVATRHGMSGGPIIHKGYGDTIVGCGVVSRGTAFGGDTESTTASALWPAYSFNIEALRGENDEQVSFVEIARQGWVDDKSNGPEHFRLICSPGEQGEGTIAWV